MLPKYLMEKLTNFILSIFSLKPLEQPPLCEFPPSYQDSSPNVFGHLFWNSNPLLGNIFHRLDFKLFCAVPLHSLLCCKKQNRFIPVKDSLAGSVQWQCPVSCPSPWPRCQRSSLAPTRTPWAHRGSRRTHSLHQGGRRWFCGTWERFVCKVMNQGGKMH